MGKNKGHRIVDTPKEAVIKTEVPVEETATEVEVPEETETTVDAIVDGVEMSLNIRKDPKVEANNQIAILAKGTKIIVVDPDKPILKDGIEWLKVRLVGHKEKDPTGNGYAMKKYIKVI